MLKKFALIIVCIFFIGQAWAQDFGFGFGFGDDVEGGSYGAASGGGLSVSISGDVSAAVIVYIDEAAKGAENINTRDMFMFSGKLNFLAQSSFAEGVINLKLVPALVPVSIDEAYIRAFFGDLEFTAGLRKLAWGKADQLGPLDIINMPDASKMFIEMADNTNLMGVKIANPLIHGALRFGQYSKIEVAFLPSFEIVSMAVSSLFGGSNEFLSLVSGPVSDRWIPAQMKQLLNMYPKKDDGTINYEGILVPIDTSWLNYAQVGLRYTTTIGSADIGAQYFYGRMFQPAMKVEYDPSSFPAYPNLIIDSIELIFNKYHHIGLDYAQVLAGFNIRAEVAANITEDLKGDDPYIYNPSIGWSFGFDRDLFLGVNLNLQGNGTVRLFHDKVGSDPVNGSFDNEAGTSMTATRITSMFSRKFLRDELELRAAVVWGIEDKDLAVIPALIWTKDDLRVALSGSFFTGDSKGQLGQYKDNNFLKVSVAYVF